jgi:MFS family permease
MLNILRNRRDLVIALAGRMVSAFGDGVALIALTLRLQADGARPYEVGLLLAAGAIPLILLARPVGRLVDAHDSRRLLVCGGLAEGAATVPLIFLHAVVPIVVLAGVLGAATCLTSATWSALLPRIVGDDHLAQAVSAQQSLSLLVLVGAPALGGLLAGAFGSGVPVAIDAASFLVITGAAALIRTRRTPEPDAGAGEPANVRSGFAILRADRVLAPLLAGVSLVVLLVGMLDVVLVYLVRVTLHAGGVWYGVAEASWVAGMVLGAVAASRVRSEPSQRIATIAGMAAICAALAGFALAPSVWVLFVLSVLGGAGNGYAGACLSTMLMTRTPESARGRVSAAANALLGGAQGGSLLLGGLVADVMSPRELYAIAGVLGLVAAGALAVAGSAPVARLQRRFGYGASGQPMSAPSMRGR